MIPTKALYKLVTEFIPDALETYESNYNTRLKVQKLVYLFEESRGTNTYGFSWYLAGPYSSVLTNQVFNSLLKADPKEIDEWRNLEFTDSINALIGSVKDLIKSAKDKNNQLEESQLFELLASIAYIKENMTSLGADEEQFQKIKNKLIANKPHFKDIQNLDEIIKLVMRYSEL